MRLREAINRKPKAVIGLSIILIAAALCALLMKMWGEGPRAGASTVGGPKAWYTIDDGKTWFADGLNRVVPFEHEGKQAYRCSVWTCDGGSTKFVSHVERLAAAARQQFAGKEKVEPWELFPGSKEVKPPLTGDRGWVNANSREAEQIQTPRCPDGKPGTPSPVPAE